jgi:hypothetical protein
MNLTKTVTALSAAKEEKIEALFDCAEPPPARSERDRIAMKGVPNWRETSPTAAVSMSIGVILKFDRKNCRYAALSTKVFALHPLSTLATIGLLCRQVVALTHLFKFVTWRKI